MRLKALAGSLSGKLSGGSKRCLSTRCSMGTSQEVMPKVSLRVQKTDAPVIVNMKKLMASREDVLSLAQGIVHWSPPPQALQAASVALAQDPSVHGYGPAEGLPMLREALREKIAKRNGLTQHDVLVTAGANQAFTNIVLALCDETDNVALFTPYYFNHLMAFQMSGSADRVQLGPCNPNTLHPDLDWLEAQLASSNKPRMVVLVNPCNPTGVCLSEAEVERAAAACAKAGVWLVLDNTYEDFVYGESKHHCSSAPNVINVFSFSKAYGAMGWRVGYIAYPTSGGPQLGLELLKVQDTIPICVTQLSQRLALEALLSGQEYVASQIQDLAGNKAMVLDALSPLGSMGNGIAGGEGAIYLWARLPQHAQEDTRAVEWLVKKHGVCVIPGSSCGAPGYIRAAYANLKPGDCQRAAGRLKAGLSELVQDGNALKH
ncbi:PLP-dependent transferase [Dunaliella salina]|uniref:PLP-dependent transferase n=1 Tax=Dunaliella salina TaxID=3046 RepID=A0ABQ7GIS4_DUNSA|nr:PLP-dependent transferase [Dunaliella salina]|eukprot:KAF5834510.1 PLP-dependent transferase [Dunaliella salina]